MFCIISLVFSFVNKENFIFENLYIAWIFQNSHTVTISKRELTFTFYAIWYIGHLLTFRQNFTEIVQGEPLCQRS